MPRRVAYVLCAPLYAFALTCYGSQASTTTNSPQVWQIARQLREEALILARDSYFAWFWNHPGFKRTLYNPIDCPYPGDEHLRHDAIADFKFLTEHLARYQATQPTALFSQRLYRARVFFPLRCHGRVIGGFTLSPDLDAGVWTVSFHANLNGVVDWMLDLRARDIQAHPEREERYFTISIADASAFIARELDGQIELKPVTASMAFDRNAPSGWLDFAKIFSDYRNALPGLCGKRVFN